MIRLAGRRWRASFGDRAARLRVGAAALAALVLLAGCAPAAAPTTAPVPTLVASPAATPAPSPTASAQPRPTAAQPTATAPAADTQPAPPGPTSPPGTPPPGLSYEEYLANTPPPPQELKAAAAEGGIRLTWQAPPPVSVVHYYGDTVLYYKVYRGTEPTKLEFLARTTELSYLDTTAQPGATYYYTVTDVRESDVESGQPNPVTATR